MGTKLYGDGLWKKKKKKKEVIFLLGQLEQFGKQYVKMKMKNRMNWTHILHIKADLTLHSPNLPTRCWKCYFCECFRYSKFYKMRPYLFLCSKIVSRHVLDFKNGLCSVLIWSQDRAAPSSDWLLSHAARSIRGEKASIQEDDFTPSREIMHEMCEQGGVQ